MTRNAPTTPSPSPADAVPLAGDWAAAFFDGILQAQRVQFEALDAWQRALATFNKDLWEQWACRYAGGVPIEV